MVEIREINGLDDLNTFLDDTPEVVHVVLFDNDQEHAPNCVMENLENLSRDKVGDALFAIADMNKVENEPLKDARELYLFPSIEFFKDKKSYCRTLGHMSEYDFYEIFDGFEDNYYESIDEGTKEE